MLDLEGGQDRLQAGDIQPLSVGVRGVGEAVGEPRPLQLQQPLAQVPAALASYALALSADGAELSYTYDTRSEQLDMVGFMRRLGEAGHELGLGLLQGLRIQPVKVNVLMDVAAGSATGASPTKIDAIEG